MSTRVHVIANLKGGVGKTTITVQLAATIADTCGGTPDSTPILAVSVDPQASMLEWAQAVGDRLPFDFTQCDDPRDLVALRDAGDYQHIFVDTPGSLADTSALRVVLEQADDIIIPILPEVMSFSPAATTIKFVESITKAPWRIVINAWTPGQYENDLEQTRGWLDDRQWPTYNTAIRKYKLHARAAAEGVTVVDYANNRVAREARADFLHLGVEVLAGNNSGQSRHALAVD